MDYFIDFEFLEDGHTIDPISLGMVAGDGRELYIQFIHDPDFDSRLTPWLRENVLPHLAPEPWFTKEDARQAILDFVGDDSAIRFWGYYADYDWVALCQVFGTMMDLPKGWPMYCRDIKQLCDDLGNPPLPEQGKDEHHALADARWNRQAWEFLHAPAGRVEDGND